MRLARAAALAAGETLLGGRGRRVLRAASHDLKIVADFRAHALILSVLEPSGIPILSEESPNSGAGFSPKPTQWVVDPLDGSVNHSCGLPLTCVSIALMSGRSPVLGVVNDFTRGELFEGIVGAGAWVNGRRIAVSSRAATADLAVMCTGLPAAGDFSGAAVRRFADRMRRFRKTRILGSAALSLAYVAAGRADAYREDGIAIWDVAAGLALVRAAGGSILCLPVPVPYRVDAWAANRKLLQDMKRLETLAQ